MQLGMVTKWAHRLLTTVLLVIVVGFAGYWYATRDTYDDKLYSKKQLTDEIWLYVTGGHRHGCVSLLFERKPGWRPYQRAESKRANFDGGSG
ncbi:hypothetical protein [Serratia ureilytica]|uniref:hypothetical protein n=1 Tax=Serratia ureilytica TaxID=300181 RepID=UPI00236315F4|nr:hypothetical protein [Serratia ureilytica]